MERLAAAGLAFLLAVLWFDLMFDVQTRGREGELPPDVLASISAYYRRVTTDAFPMNRLVAATMLLTLAAIGAQIVHGDGRVWVAWLSLAIVGFGVVQALTRTVPNAVRLGSALDPPAVQSDLARAIYRDHRSGFARILLVLGLQLFGS